LLLPFFAAIFSADVNLFSIWKSFGKVVAENTIVHMWKVMELCYLLDGERVDLVEGFWRIWREFSSLTFLNFT
jgi:hypothetical protein